MHGADHDRETSDKPTMNRAANRRTLMDKRRDRPLRPSPDSFAG